MQGPCEGKELKNPHSLFLSSGSFVARLKCGSLTNCSENGDLLDNWYRRSKPGFVSKEEVFVSKTT